MESVGLSFDSFRDSLFSEYRSSVLDKESVNDFLGEITFDSMKEKMFGSVYERPVIETGEQDTGSNVFSFGRKLGIGV